VARVGAGASVEAARLRVVRVSGSPRERGRTVGREAADLVHRSLAFYRGFLERRGVGLGELGRLLDPFRAAALRAFPAYTEEVDGLAEGADADPTLVFAANAWEELEPLVEPDRPAPAPDRCTAFVLTGPEGS